MRRGPDAQARESSQAVSDRAKPEASPSCYDQPLSRIQNNVHDAATVVVVRPSVSPTGARELFMVRRSTKTSFMPDALVFPGGRVDACDGQLGHASTFECAARRECAEEIGVFLDDLSLQWIDTWITPSREPRRFHARFFIAYVDRDITAHADGVETHDGRWDTSEAILSAWRLAHVDLPPPTLCILFRLQDHAGAFECDATELARPILPKWITCDGFEHVVLPHDPEYVALPGDGAPAPRRVFSLPTRFRREKNRWLPCT